MKQVYKKYTDWECFKNGMYSELRSINLTDKSKQLLNDRDLFYEKGLEMVKAWSVSAQNHLTNTSSNRYSWVGQATCCFVFGSSMADTISAWGELDNETRNEANLTADKIIKNYEAEYYTIHKDLGEEMLF